MRKTRRFNSREKQIFLVGFSLTSPRFLQISKNRLNTSLSFLAKCNLSERFFFSSAASTMAGRLALLGFYRMVFNSFVWRIR